MTPSETQTIWKDYEVIVIGAGVAGSALATTFARDNRKVLLIERDWKEPDRIVGELMQPGGLKALKELGLEDCAEGIEGIDNLGYAVIHDKEEVVFQYPENKTPRLGKGFHHGRFIMKLRAAAKQEKNVTCLEGAASSLIHDPTTNQVIGVSVSLKENDETVTKEFFAPLTFVADGCFSKFRKQFITKDVTVRDHFIGLVLEDCKLPHKGYGHVVLAKPAPILLYQIAPHDTRILIDIPGKLPNAGNGDLKNYLLNTVAPQLPSSIRPSFHAALENQRIRSMPNSFLPPSLNKTPGLILLGDAMNMRHPLTGGGMTVALWDVYYMKVLLGRNGDSSLGIKGLEDLKDTKEILARLRKWHWMRKGRASVVNVLAMALWELFAAGDGGRCVSTPVGLLAGLIPSPLTLVGHFFAVALFAVYQIVVEEGRNGVWRLP
ncbi:Squalene epoxidase, partial [Quaeritorhiza haematococci]